MRKYFSLFVLQATLFASAFSQAHPESHPTTNVHHESFKPFRVAVMIGHTSVPPGDMSEHLFVPSWGLDLEYWFNPQWGIGSHNDIEIESFVVEVDHEEFIEREYPLVTTFEVLYKPWKGLVLQAGPGYEIEKGKNYGLIRYGIEYEIELPGHWDIFPSVFYDSRIDAFDTCSIGLGVGKRF